MSNTRLEAIVGFIDTLWRINKKKEQQLPAKEFHNGAINDMVDLK